MLAARWLGLPPTDGRLLVLDTGTVSVLGYEHDDPAVLRWNKSVNAGQQAAVARALGVPDQDAADAVAKLISDLGMPSRLRDVGVKREHFDAIAAGSLTNLFVTQNPRPVKRREDVLEILEAAY